MKPYEKLKNARQRIGITQDYVSKHLNIPRTAVVQIENGSRKISTDELTALCNLYGLSADYVLNETEEQGSFRYIARSFESLSEKDRLEIASLIEFKKQLAARKKEIEH